MANSSERTTRTFTKKVGDKTLTREVTGASSEVEALFEGFTEKPSSKTGTSGNASRPASGSSS